jgi:hypothetical protein
LPGRQVGEGVSPTLDVWVLCAQNHEMSLKRR